MSIYVVNKPTHYHNKMQTILDYSFELQSDQPEELQNFCMCGWPQNLLLPKGTIGGYLFRFFIMITNYILDKVNIYFNLTLF